MKVIFLDFDGVIVTAHDRFTAGDKLCIDILNEITDKTGAKIVVSSTWRLGSSVDELRELLKSWEVKGEVIGKTPKLKGERGYEISAWLKDYPEVTEFVILDDDSDMANLLHKLVKCHVYHGIQVEQIDEVIKQLGGMMEVADIAALKAAGTTPMRVRLPLPPPRINNG